MANEVSAEISILSCDYCSASICDVEQMKFAYENGHGHRYYYVTSNRIYNTSCDDDIEIYCVCCKYVKGSFEETRRGFFAVLRNVVKLTYKVKKIFFCYCFEF